MEFQSMRGREVHVGQHISLGFVHEGREFGQSWLHPVDHLAPLDAGGGLVLLCENGADESGGEPASIAPGMGEKIAHEVYSAALPRRAQHSDDGGLQALMGIGDDQFDPA